MASLQKVYTATKLTGQVYTPNYIVRKMLNDAGYCSARILGKHVLDPACGDGRFLSEIVRTIIHYSPKESLEHHLQFVNGWDIDAIAVAQCIDSLQAIVRPLGLNVQWNVRVCNALTQVEGMHSIFAIDIPKFDYVFGNPPYIRIQHLDEAQRRYIQANFSFCKSGSTDIYIAFFELAYHLLSPDGVCAYITPNTFFYTETAAVCRRYFAEKKAIQQITNYGEIQLFDNATTYSAIVIFNRRLNDVFLFQRAKNATVFEEKRISIVDLPKDKIWQLSIDDRIKAKKGTILLKDVCSIHVGITTLCDKAYIFTYIEEEGEYVIVNTRLKGLIKLERSILKAIIKGSTLKSSDDPITEYVLFPYRFIEGKQHIIEEQVMREEYPLAYDYLCSVREDLDARDNGKPNTVAWYAFGRSQGLVTSFGSKLIFSPMNLRPNFVYYPNEECTFYSGYCIKYSGSYEQLAAALNTEEMRKFIEVSSRDFRGGWKAYNKKVVENFPIPSILKND